ncbi:MAG: DNA methyltransferase [Enhygromyxa sp.]
MSELERKFHETWLGMVQPSEGLVVSVPVLIDGQVMDRTHSAEHQRILLEQCPAPEQGRRHVVDLQGFLEALLELGPKRWDAGEALPRELALHVPEGPQTIVPTLAIHHARKPNDQAAEQGGPEQSPAVVAGRGYQLLVWDLSAAPELGGAGEAGVGLSLDKPETLTGKWEYPPAAKFDRLLRHCRVPIGLLTNREVVRLVYAPHGESSGTLSFRVADMAETAGRPILDAFVGLLHRRRLFVLGEDRRLPALLAESRQRQANVTNELADQVFEALEALLRGFEAAAERDGDEQLGAALEHDDDHLYGGLLTILLRLVFLLYAEDRGLMPVEHELYQRHMSVLGLFERLQVDAGAHPDSMHRRFGAWDRLIATWRAVYLGVSHGELHMPPRHGQLFDPHLFPFIEGWGPSGSAPIIQPEARAEVRTPSIADDTVLTVLDKLLIFQGQRLSYRALDVEQIGSVYEALMGYHAVRLEAAAVCLKPQRARKVWLSAKELLEVPQSRRAAWLKDEIGLSKQHATKLAAAIKQANARTEAELLAVLEDHKLRGTQRAEAGRVVLQPGHERRRTSSHYTPRSLTAPIVERTLEPLIAAMRVESPGEAPGSELLLSLKICDPAMGSGAFLVEVCRQLAEHVVAAWTREGKLAKIVSDFDDPVMHARRMVAQRCVYGVDKNPFAVNLAKLSLWLVTLAKDLPFTFVDHALRHGDSLVGLSFDQIRVFHWKPDAKQQELFADEVRAALDEAVELRQDICNLADDETPEGVREKERLLRDAEDALSRIRLIGDLIVGAFFAKDKDKAREKERVRRMELVAQWLRSRMPPTEELLAMQAQMRERTPVFHWMVEFPEVFYAERPDPLEGGTVNRAAFMDAFVGNPPFAGKNAISASSGDDYIFWLMVYFAPAHGNTDLSAYFFRRVSDLVGAHGTIGLIATNTIAQGDTRETGMKQLLAQPDTSVYRADRSLVWPGMAAVTVSVIHIAKGSPLAQAIRTIDGVQVDVINSRLLARPERPDPVSLDCMAERGFAGAKLFGQGFVLAADEAKVLISERPENVQVIQSYIGGVEINNTPSLLPERFVINFGHMSLEEAGAWPELLEIARQRVKPEREHNKRKTYQTYWWRLGEAGTALYAALAGLERCLVLCQVSKNLCFAWQQTSTLFAHTLCVFAISTDTGFAALQSRVHEVWAVLLSSSMKSDLRYTPSDCFSTFPFPHPDPRAKLPPLEDIGQRLYDRRAAYMLATNQGLTKTYNLLKDPTCEDEEIVALRRLHEELDRKILDAYGWTDIPVPAYGTPTTDAERKALEGFEDEVIDRLFVLNAERAAEEARLGLSTRGKSKARKSRKKKPAKDDDDGQQSLL